MKRGVVVCYVLFGLLFLSCSDAKPTTVYVENGKLYNEFTMTKELSSQLEGLASNRKMILDSMKLELEMKSKELQLKGQDVSQEEYNSFEVKRQNFIVREKGFKEEQMRLQESYNNQIWDRLNKLVSEYGEEKEYDYILGGTGDGSLMYSKKDNNVTEDLINYCNSKYSGN